MSISPLSYRSSDSTIPVSSAVPPAQEAENTGTTGSTDATSGVPAAEEQDEFSLFMKNAFTGKTTVSEEELFAALIEQRLNGKSAETAAAFRTAKDKYVGLLSRSDGYVCLEEVAKGAMQDLVANGVLSKEEMERICGEAFSAAQLDANTEFLYDDRGDTKAVATIEEALFKMRSVVGKLEGGELKIEARPLDYSSQTGSSGFFPTIESLLLGITEAEASSEGESEEDDYSSSSGSGRSGGSGSSSESSGLELPSGLSEETSSMGPAGFRWLPVASDGTLHVVMPNDNFESVGIYTDLPASQATRLEQGSKGEKQADGSVTYSFSKPGKDYGYDLYVVGRGKDGKDASYAVGDGSKEVTG